MTTIDDDTAGGGESGAAGAGNSTQAGENLPLPLGDEAAPARRCCLASGFPPFDHAVDCPRRLAGAPEGPGWTCLVCGSRHASNEAGMLIAGGGWMVCCACERTASERRLDGDRPVDGVWWVCAEVLDAEADLGKRYPTREAAIAAGRLVAGGEAYQIGRLVESREAAECPVDALALVDQATEAMESEWSEGAREQWGDLASVSAALEDLDWRIDAAWNAWIETHDLYVTVRHVEQIESVRSAMLRQTVETPDDPATADRPVAAPWNATMRCAGCGRDIVVVMEPLSARGPVAVKQSIRTGFHFWSLPQGRGPFCSTECREEAAAT